MFIMDESSSIWPDPFDKQKQFIKDVTDGFHIGFNGTRVGLVRFASGASLAFPMNANYTKAGVFNAIGNIVQRGGNTNTGEALKVAREQGFSAANGARPFDETIPQIAIVITDGNSQVRN